MSEQENLIKMFREITNADEDRAKFFLDSAGGDLSLATASFFEETATGVDMEQNPPSHSDSDEQDTPPPMIHFHGPGSSKSKSKDKKPKSKKNSRFGTIAGLKQQEEEDEDSDEEEGQAFYAGGSIHSGQQVIGPSKKKKDIVAEMFKSVQEQGPEVLAEAPARPRAGGNQFVGTGYRLGQTSEDTEIISAGPSNASQPDRQIDITLKLWKEGFSINDGELRSYQDPKNTEFLNAIKKGVVPTELLRDARGGEVHLSMVDNRHETYVAPKQKVKTFSGAGNMLGSPTPTAVGQTKITDEKDRAANENAAKEAIKVNTSQSTTNVQIRLADGSRLIGTFNQEVHTVAEIRTFINVARPEYESASYDLSTTFPSKVLSDNSQTIKDAGLQNAAIVQKLK